MSDTPRTNHFLTRPDHAWDAQWIDFARQLERELATNPFLRADDPALMAKWGGSAPYETFAALRAAKDNF